ncbi:LysM peptidoglycan-binding domain-containing protein [Allostreptomyces psammosilenae]|uniref:LysM domain-containing protein n=1 Tax=Allostreptomyces psammosilenae TaxID=1892865 RepID=A0A852ZLX2_9ACTN|nr:transglycosylase family protein [Allostreptomyces psammosilenae]NYI03406.1 hypothetical protein [Allostreptomyces psammosilenae]
MLRRFLASTTVGSTLLVAAAPGAGAAPERLWDALAQCESGGDWQANTGNGFYGGLQISLATWEAHHGLDFAARPDLAPRADQITVAEHIRDTQGWDAWPHCSVQLGLGDRQGEEDGAAAADTAGDGYTVQPGDTLHSIADRFAVEGGWLALYRANREQIGPDPGHITPGTVLVIP